MEKKMTGTVKSIPCSNNKIFLVILFLFYLLFCKQSVAKDIEEVEQAFIRLSNARCELIMALNGGALIDFHLVNNPVNPLSWKLSPGKMPPNNQDGAVFQGHFLCTGRWGSPTQGEMAAGIPHNGDLSNTRWAVKAYDITATRMVNQSEREGLHVERELLLSPDQAIAKVTETFTNTLAIGRVNNIVQHSTLGRPFLTPSVVINTNATRGFMQHLSFPDPEKYEYVWPLGIIDSSFHTIDMRQSSTALNYVSTHVFHDSLGWVTAYHPAENILFGYIWKTSDYPWLNIWHQQENGKPVAKGLEFGTTGIGRPYTELLGEECFFHGNPSYFFHDAKQNLKKSYYMFLISTSPDFQEVDEIRVKEDQLVVVGYNGKEEVIKLPARF